MGKLPIIPRGDTTRDDSRAVSGEQAERTSTTATVVARFSANADSAAADRDRRYPVAIVSTRGSAAGEKCARENSAVDGRAIARLRRNTWHAESESVEVVIDTSNKRSSNAVGNNVEEDRTSDGADVLRDAARIADDEHTCCAAIDVASFRARRRDRIERRNRRAGGALLLTRSRSIGASIDVAQVGKILRNTVDSITTGRREDRDRFSAPLANVFECDGRISSNDRESIGNGITTERARTGSESSDDPVGDGALSSHRDGSSARLIGIASVESLCEKRPRIFGEGANDGASSSSRLSVKIDRGGRKRARTDACTKPPRIGLVLRASLLGVFAMSLLCDAVLAAPSPSDAMENLEDEELATTGNRLGDGELEIIRRSIVQGLGLQRIPDSSKVSFIDHFRYK